jgi:AcrR family transcriptional regulator
MTDSVRPRPAGRPRRAVLDKDRIAEAAMAIVDETGDFTLPELARRLGVQAASIYHYVDGRAGVIELLRGRIGGLIDPAPLERQPAEVALRAYFRSYRDVFAAHARVLPLLATTTVRSPEVIPAYERVIALLRETGVPPGDVMAVLTAMENFILGSALDLAGPEVMWDVPPGVEAPFLNEALAAQPEGTRRADRAFELGLDTMLGLMLRYAARD